MYAAEDTQLGDRLVAVKEMSQRGLTPNELDDAKAAFQQEAHLLAKLRHPNLPAIYDYFEESGRWYLVMELIEGETLESALAKVPGGRFSIKEGLDLAIQLCTVLNYLHTHQPPIIFRDLKPANIMLTPRGEVYLIDFGIARHFKPGQSKDTIAFGSPGFAAPEQCGKAQTTTQSDIYSLGATLYQMFSGNDPADHPFVFAPMQLQGPAELEPLILQMIESDQRRRPASMALIKQQLQQMLAIWTGSGPIMGSAPFPNPGGLRPAQATQPRFSPHPSGSRRKSSPPPSVSAASRAPQQVSAPNMYSMRPLYPPLPAPYPRHLYSKLVLIGLIVTFSISMALFVVGGSLSDNVPANSFLMSLANVCLSVGGIFGFYVVPIAVLIVDARGFVTLNGFIKWRRMHILVRLIVGYFFLGLFPFLLCVYFFQAFLTYRRASASSTPSP